MATPPSPDPATDIRSMPFGTSSLLMQMLWGILFAAWNFRGLSLIAHHQAPIGPDASMTTALMAIGLIVALMVTAKRSAPAYGAASVLVLGVAAWSAFVELSADGGQWASDGARITALGLNAIGILGAALALTSLLRRRRAD